MHPKKLLSLALLGSALLVAAPAFAQSQDTAQALLDLLVKKGIVTQQEADDLKGQVQANAAQAPAPAPATAAAAPAQVPAAPSPGGGGVPPTMDVAGSPLSFRIGAANFTPVGFMDFTGVYRSTTVGSGIGTSFGSIPYSNTNGSTIGMLSETRFSTQNSRVGLRVDSNVGTAKILGYTEADFLGNAANNLTEVSNADTLRMRVYFVDAQLSSGWEFLAGQDWSLLTPNRKGLSPMPSDIFYSNDMDTNYQVGLAWARQPQIRAVYHATDEWTLGVSAENPDQYAGSALTLPTTNFNANEVDISSGSNSSGTTNPNVMPDLIGKIAYDTKAGDSTFHAEMAGLVSEFEINTYADNGAINTNSSTTGYGGAFNMDFGLTPTFHLIENAFTSEGGGRYISTGLGPDFVVEPANGAGVYTITPEEASSGILGFEWQALPCNAIDFYYGVAVFGSKYYQTGPTSYLGYGYPGSSNSQNRRVEEYSLDDIVTVWKNPRYGALQFILQASYLDRDPFSIAAGAPTQARVGMFYFDTRYTLP